MPPKGKTTPAPEDENAPPPTSWEENLDLAIVTPPARPPARCVLSLGLLQLQEPGWEPFCCLLRSQESRVVRVPNPDPKKDDSTDETIQLLPFVADELKAAPPERLVVLEPASLAQAVLEAASQKGAAPPEPGSIEAAVAEAGAENVSEVMVAALVQQRLIKDRAEDRAAAEAAAEAAAAAAEEPAEEALDEPAAANEPRPDRIYMLTGWPQSAEQLSALQDRGVWVRGGLELHNPPEYAPPQPEGGVEETPPEPEIGQDQLLSQIQQRASTAAAAVPDVFTDFVWIDMDVPLPLPIPEDEEPDPDAPPPTPPSQLAAEAAASKATRMWSDVAAFQRMLAAQKVHQIPPLDPGYDSGFYSRLLDSVPSKEISVPLILDIAMEQVGLNTSTTQEHTAKEDDLRREQLLQMMDSTLSEANGAEGLNGTSGTSGQLLTLMRHGDQMGRADEASKAAVRQSVEEAVGRLHGLIQLPGSAMAHVFPHKRLTEQERGARRTALYNGTRDLGMSAVGVERALMLRQFQQMLALDSGALLDRTIVECFGPDTLSQVVNAATVRDVQRRTSYYEDHNVCLLAVWVMTPLERISKLNRQVALPLRPRCAQWLIQERNAQSVQPLVQFSCPVLSEAVVASQSITESQLSSQLRQLFPNDNGELRTDNGNGDCTLFHEGLVCGLRQLGADKEMDSTFVASYADGCRLSASVEPSANGATQEASLQFTTPAGLTVSMSSLGRVQQCHHGYGAVPQGSPLQRVVLPDGTVVLQYEGGRRQLLFANGNVADRDCEGLWVSCNNLGARVSTDADKRERYVPSVDVTEFVDFETKARVCTRGDGVCIVEHTDGTRTVKHADGTKMITSKCGRIVTVEAAGYATVQSIPAECRLDIELVSTGSVLCCTPDRATIDKHSGDISLSRIEIEFGNRVVTVHPCEASLKDGGKPHKFDLVDGSYGMVDADGNTFVSGHTELGAAVDLWVDPAKLEAELAADRAATVASRVLVVGAQGSGKSLTCEYLVERHQYTVVDMDELVAAAMSFEEPDEGWPEDGCLEQTAQQLMEAEGGMDHANFDAVQLRVALLSRKVHELGDVHWVVDGFPTNAAEANEMFAQGLMVQRVLSIECSADECANRLLEKDVTDEDARKAWDSWAAEVPQIRALYSGIYDAVDGEAPHEPGRPQQRPQKMHLEASSCVRPANFPGLRVQLAVSGTPGAGCTEQARRVCNSFGCVLVDPVKLAPPEEESATPEQQAQRVKEMITSEQCSLYGWVLDGWPRTVAQLEAAQAAGIELQKLLLLGEVDDDEASRRLTEQAGGGEANETAAKAKIEAYNEAKEDLVQWFEGKEHGLCCVDAGAPGEGAPEEQTRATVDEVNARVSCEVQCALQVAASAHLSRTFLLGPPGSGKTTQCLALAAANSCVHVSPAALVDAALSGDSELCKKVQDGAHTGASWRSVPDDVMVELVKERLSHADCVTSGWLLDGFPGSSAQAEMLRDAGVVPKQVIVLHVDEELAVERVMGRRIDPTDNTIYHKTLHPPDCIQVYERIQCNRSENEEGARERLEAYSEGVEELKELYEVSGKLEQVDGSGSIIDSCSALQTKLFGTADAHQETPEASAEGCEADFGQLRLFVVHEDGSGLELLRPTDIESYVQSKKSDHCSKLITEPQPGDEDASTWLACFTKRVAAQPAAGIHASVTATPKVLMSTDPSVASKSAVYEYRHLVQSSQVSQPDFEKIISVQDEIAQAEANRLDKAKAFAVADLRTFAEREAELAVARQVLDALKADPALERQCAISRLESPEKELGSTAEVRRVQFEPEKPKSKLAGGSSRKFGPSHSTHRHDLLQCDSYTNYFESDQGKEQLEGSNSGSPVSPQEATHELSAPPPTGITPEHVLEAVEPLPKLSNNQMTPLSQAIREDTQLNTNAQPLPPISQNWPEYTGRDVGVNPPPNVYGQERTNPIPVPSALQLRPGAEQNVNFSRIEEPVRRSTRTSAALNLSMSGVGINGRDPARGFLMRPEMLHFGNVQSGKSYSLVAMLMNGGIEGNRFQLRKPPSCIVKYKTGMVAPGMAVRLQVQFSSDKLGPFSEEIQIITESDIFRLPVHATVLDENSYDALEASEQSTATMVLNPNATNHQQTQ